MKHLAVLNEIHARKGLVWHETFCWYLFKVVKRTRGSGNGIEPWCKPTLTFMLSCWGFGRMFLGVVNLGLEFTGCFDGMVVVASGLP